MIRSKNDFMRWICHKNLKNYGPTFQDYPNAIRFNLVHLCPSVLLFAFVVFLSFMLFIGGHSTVTFPYVSS